MKGKKTISLIATLLFATSIFTGCATPPPTAGSAKPTQPAKPAEQKPLNGNPQKDENGNYIMTQVGQKVQDPDGSVVELMKIKNINEKINIKPIEVTIKDIKIFKWSNLPELDKKQIASLSNQPSLPEPFYYLQIVFNAENKSNQNVMFTGLRTIVLSDGSQIDADSQDFIVGNDDTDLNYYGKVKKECVVGVVIKNPNINKVKLIFTATSDSNTWNQITPEQQVEYQF